MIEIEKNIQDCDVLIVGGGIAGLMAAIAAASQGAKVVIAEKANSRRSGCLLYTSDAADDTIPV